MVQAIVIEGQTVDADGILTLHVDQKIRLKIAPEQAQKQANSFVHLEISTQLHAQPPLLVIGEDDKVVWRVPIHLTFPSFGDVGSIGFLHVDPTTGDIDTSPATIQNLTEKADALASRFASPTAHPI